MDASDPEQVKARLAMNKNRGGGGAGTNVGVQKNTNKTARLGGSNIGFGQSEPEVAKPKRSVHGSKFGQSSAPITGGDLKYGAKEDLTEEEEAMGWSKDMPESTKTLLKRLRMNLKRRGASGIAGLARKFRIIDDDGSGSLCLPEFTKCMKESKVNFNEDEVKEIFEYFDADGSGQITYDEFLGGLRGELNMRRAQLVLMAFDILDKDKSGYVDIDDITEKYDAKSAPDVISGKKTEKEVLKEFLDTFDQGDKDGKVHPDEFCKYYSNVSASIDLDDYFELMIRNAWHIPGGEGWCANTANKRVLVKHPDGRETVECINNDLGLDLSDPEAIAAALREQGIDAAEVHTVGKIEDDSSKKGAAPPPPVLKSSQALGKQSAGADKKAARNLPKGHALTKTSLW